MLIGLIRTYWIAYYIKNDDGICFDNSGVENVSKKINKY